MIWMHSVETSTLAWVGFFSFILVMLAIDLGVFNRKPHEISYRNAVIWSVVWVTLALVFAGLLVGPLGWELFGPARHKKALEFVTGYLIELSLSVDNLFVFLLIFSYFKVPPKYQHRVLYWGVLGALVMRVTMILVGTELIDRFHWIIYILGAFLVYTGIQMLRGGDTELEPDKQPIIRFITRHVPIVRHYERQKFFTKVDGKRVGTLLFLGSDSGGSDRSGFCSRFDPRHLRRHHRSIHCLHLERLCDPGIADLLLPAGGSSRKVSLPQESASASCWDSSA